MSVEAQSSLAGNESSVHVPDRMAVSLPRRWFPPMALLALLIGSWEAAVRVFQTPDYILPPPSAVAVVVVADRGLFMHAAAVTLLEVVLGFALGVGVALLAACAIHFSLTLRRALLPLLVVSQTVPIVVIAPILMILLGFALTPKVVVVGLVCFFPIVVNAVDGLGSTDASHRELMNALAAGRIAVFRRLEFPTALPLIFSGARVSATYAAVGAVFAEWTGSSNGLGFVILQAQPALATSRIFASVTIVCLIALSLSGTVAFAERIVMSGRRHV